MARAQRNVALAFAIVVTILIAILFFTASADIVERHLIPAHDTPIVASDGSIHADAKGWLHFFHSGSSNGEWYYATSSEPRTIHLRGFDKGQYPEDLYNLDGWKVDLVTTNPRGGGSRLCSSSDCGYSSIDPKSRVYLYVSNNGHWQISTFHTGLTYSDSSQGCEKLGGDGESVCIHITGVVVTTKNDGEAHPYSCRGAKGNCTVTIGKNAQDPK